VGLAEQREEGGRTGSLRRRRRLPPAPVGSPDAAKKPLAAVGLLGQRRWGEEMGHLGFPQEPILIYRSEIGG
jgi:hypothetical protein